MKVSIGIDLGNNGYISIFDQRANQFEFHQIPLIGKLVDVKKYAMIISDIVVMHMFDEIHCVIEDVHAIFGAAAKSTFNWGYGCGIVEALLTANGIPYTKVIPKKWQKEMFEGIPKQMKPSTSGKTMITDTKLMALMAAQRLFPNIDLRDTERCKNPHDGKVDALLMCEYCKRHF